MPNVSTNNDAFLHILVSKSYTMSMHKFYHAYEKEYEIHYHI